MFLFFLYPRHKYIRKISMVLVYMYILYETANAWILTKFYFMYFFFFLTFFLYIYDADIKRKEHMMI